MDSTTRILERRFATVLILRVMENPGCLKKDVVRMEPESTRVKGQTLDELIDYGIVCVEQKKYKNNAKHLYLTETGLKVAQHLRAIHNALPYVECNPREY